MEKKDQSESVLKTLFLSLFCRKNHEGVFDGMILPTDIVHNDVIRYLTIQLGSWR